VREDLELARTFWLQPMLDAIDSRADREQNSAREVNYRTGQYWGRPEPEQLLRSPEILYDRIWQDLAALNTRN